MIPNAAADPMSNQKNETTNKCKVCGYEWTSHNPDPATCANPQCRSRRWRVGRQRPSIKERDAAVRLRRLAIETIEKTGSVFPDASEIAKGLQDNGAFVVADLNMPVISGTTNAGPLLELGESPEQYQRLSRVLDIRPHDIFVTVNEKQGDSLTGDGIQPGDVLQFRDMGSVPRDNQIALMLMMDEYGRAFSTAKHFHMVNEQLFLTSSNPDYPPIVLDPAEARVLGVMVRRIPKADSR